MKKRFLALLSVIAMVLSVGCNQMKKCFVCLEIKLVASSDTCAACLEKMSKMEYIEEGGCLSLKGMGACTSSVIAVPSKVDGMSVKYVAERAFENDKHLERVLIGGGITAIEIGAFQGCYNLREVKFKLGLTRIDSAAFKDCSSIKKLSLPSTIITIGESPPLITLTRKTLSR